MIKGVTKTIENKTKEQDLDRYLGMLLDTWRTNLLASRLAGEGVIGAESAKWHAGILTCFGCFKRLVCLRAWHATMFYILAVLYVLACLACLHTIWTWCAYILGVSHKMTCLACFMKCHAWPAWTASLNGVLGMLYKWHAWHA